MVCLGLSKVESYETGEVPCAIWDGGAAFGSTEDKVSLGQLVCLTCKQLAVVFNVLWLYT
jgi:hypothetical protein